MSDVSTDPLAARYGRPGPARRRGLVVAAAFLALVGLAWVGWVVWSQSTPEVQSSLRTYDVVDTHRADASVAVRARSADVEASCQLRAYGADRTTVGELNFDVTGVEGTEVREVTLRTERRASSVQLVGCTADGQNRPR
ncbi:MAG: DUF4307 domain-containing protein [Humibacillus sp.]